MYRIIIAAALLLHLSSCKRDYVCYCFKNGQITSYEFHKMKYSDALHECDSYVVGDTCDIPPKM